MLVIVTVICAYVFFQNTAIIMWMFVKFYIKKGYHI